MVNSWFDFAPILRLISADPYGKLLKVTHRIFTGYSQGYSQPPFPIASLMNRLDSQRSGALLHDPINRSRAHVIVQLILARVRATNISRRSSLSAPRPGRIPSFIATMKT